MGKLNIVCVCLFLTFTVCLKITRETLEGTNINAGSYSSQVTQCEYHLCFQTCIYLRFCSGSQRDSFPHWASKEPRRLTLIRWKEIKPNGSCQKLAMSCHKCDLNFKFQIFLNINESDQKFIILIFYFREDSCTPTAHASMAIWFKSPCHEE